jgi:hypothetical protein
MKTKPNSPAHPTDVTTHIQAGLTKREYFAAMAMQGLLAKGYDYRSENWIVDTERVAYFAIQLADALIIELNIPVKE